MGLRDYQIEALDNIKTAKRDGINKMLGVLPTGSGKTVVFSHIPEATGLQPGRQIMVLVHRNELVYQSAEKLATYNPDLHIDIERAHERADPNADIIVASVATIGKGKKGEDGSIEYSPRLRKFDPLRLDTLVIDECHHAAKGESYANVMRYFGMYKPEPENDWAGDKTLIGVTATPNRSDNLGLENILDSIVFKRDLRTMIGDGWLADVRAFRIDTSVDISKVKTNRGDFAIGELEEAINTPERNSLILEKYKECGDALPFFGFTVDVQHAIDLAETFNAGGVKCYMISGATPEADRKKLLQMFRDRQIRGLFSCGVLSEGVDLPMACCGLMCRPTKSNLLYIQQVGRVLRPYPAPEELLKYSEIGVQPKWVKPYAIVLDFCDLSGRHQLNTVPTLFGLRPDFDLKGESAPKTAEEIERIISQKNLPVDSSQFKTLQELQGVAERIDLFATPHIPDEMRQVSQMAWVTGATGGYQMCLPEPHYAILRLSQDTLGKWNCHRSVKGVSTLMFSESDLPSIVRRAEATVPDDAKMLLKTDAKWRLGKPTDAQLGLLWKLDGALRSGFADQESFSRWAVENKSKGEISTLISQHLGSASNQKRQRQRSYFAGRNKRRSA